MNSKNHNTRQLSTGSEASLHIQRRTRTLAAVAALLITCGGAALAAPQPARADASPGTLDFTGTSTVSYLGMAAANGARSGGSDSVYYGTYPSGTPYIPLSNGQNFAVGSTTWGSLGSSVWVHNWGCSASSASEADCPNIYNGNGLTTIENFGYAVGTTSSPIAGNYYELYQDGTDAPAGLYFPFYWDGSSANSGTPDTRTRVVSTVPVSGSTIASSSAASFGAQIYVNANDYSAGDYLEIKYLNQLDAQTLNGVPANIEQLAKTIDFPITGVGLTTYSTTSPALHTGLYTMTTTIKGQNFINSVMDFLGYTQFATFGLNVATTTGFTVDQPNSFDNMVASTTNAMQAYVASSTLSLNACNIGSLVNPVDCLNMLFIPQMQPIQTALVQFRNGFLSYAPWGYATRFFVILTTAPTTPLPDFTFTLPSGFPGGGTVIDLTPWNDLLGSTAPLSTATNPNTGQTLRASIEPSYDDFVYFLFIIGICWQILGVSIKGEESGLQSEVRTSKRHRRSV